MTLVGIDLAWGERRPDAVAILHARPRSGTWGELSTPHGDDALLATVTQSTGDDPALIAVDGPLICPNPTGARPVDRLTHRLFHRQHAGCHPANLTLCPRPPRIGALLTRAGFTPHWDLAHPRLAFEVYPHPALVRFLHLDRILGYKRGPVANRRIEFLKLQSFVRAHSAHHHLALSPGTDQLLTNPWSKSTEDLVDAMVCALIAHHHWKYRGRKSQILGDPDTGFLVLPAADQALPPVPPGQSR